MARANGLTRFTRAAAEAGIQVDPVSYAEETRTAADAAAAIGCEVAQIVKSLLCIGPDGPLLALTAGHNRLDLAKLGDLVGGVVRMATPEEARAVTGYAIGGTPPFGHPAPIYTLVDPDLRQHSLVFAAAGTPNTCFPIRPDQLIDASRGGEAEFTVA